MKVLEYDELDLTGVKAQYQKLRRMLEQDDFRSAEVKKLAQGGYYRAKLDHSNRLLFRIGRHGGERYALILEVIRNHAYDKSRFLSGAVIDEDRLEALFAESLHDEVLPELPYVNPQHGRFHLLDKVISFDEAQEAIYRLPPPVLIIGSAGSGKTALTLEKLKQVEGDALYVTLSAYLAQNARELYYANGYDNERQQLDFLSLREFLETFRVPRGREIDYTSFRGWFERHRQQAGFCDAHQLFEEFRGVLTGQDADAPWLSREQYLALGVKQSIFLEAERERVYALFEKYRAFLAESGRYDANLLAHEYLGLCEPRYDFVVVDEVQDLTNVQLTLILKSLRRPGQFLLCGDSNQIVHPNFFSWSRLKTLFYRDEALEAREITRILHTNYRSAPRVTALANTLLKIKQSRFGSIDRESNYLISSVAADGGSVALLPAKDAMRRELNDKTRHSTRYAVLVMRDEHKAEARKLFQTPLLFSIQEAKGLEYENIILLDFVSGERKRFGAIAEGVNREDLTGDELRYARGRDKTDKSLEAYKFFINALYVAVTRATQNVYLLESEVGHPLLCLLGLDQAREQLGLARQDSSLEEWQREARRLELQGKQEQAEAIRKTVLREKTVPWEVMTPERFAETLAKALDPKQISKKPRQHIEEYAACHDDVRLMRDLHRIGWSDRRNERLHGLMAGLARKHFAAFEGRHFKDVLRNTEQYGVDYRNAMNQTPLMIAARVGNVALVEALLERGADPALTDGHACSAYHLALRRAYLDEAFARGAFAALHARLAPPSVDVESVERLWKLDAHTMEWFVLNSMIALFRTKLEFRVRRSAAALAGFSTRDFIDAVQHFPESVLHASRKKRTYWNSVLARNEVGSDYAYNRRLFLRTVHGAYLLHPALALRRGEGWVPVYDALNLELLRRYPESEFYDPAAILLDWIAERLPGGGER